MRFRLFLLQLLAAFIILSSFSFFDDEGISLFDKNGDTKAYIDEDNTIYLWDGTPVAYLYKTDEEWHVYGFNGKHLGWFCGAIIYDKKGKRVSSPFNTKSKMLPFKSIKHITPIKSIREFEPFSKPTLSDDWGDTLLEDFLKAGEK